MVTGGQARGGRAAILVVEDNEEMAELMREVLESTGYSVRHAGTAGEARKVVTQSPPDLIILDLILPDLDGLIFCANVKATADVPIVICSGTRRRWDAVLGLKLGADDFISKPFDVDDLIARVEAVLRRARYRRPAAPVPATGNTLQVGDLILDWDRRQVSVGGQNLQLTPAEFGLLSVLIFQSNTTLRREELARAGWGREDGSGGRAVDAHIRRLRAKLSQYQRADTPLILSVRGSGYKLVPSNGGQISAVA